MTTNNDNNDDDYCQLCTDKILSHDKKTLPCDHSFHDGCIDYYIDENPVNTACPICKKIFDTQEDEDESVPEGRVSMKCNCSGTNDVLKYALPIFTIGSGMASIAFYRIYYNSEDVEFMYLAIATFTFCMLSVLGIILRYAFKNKCANNSS